ncbi:MAG: DMT family transporter [Kofleriaceae bacterium]|nr:DMT family transporter [Kofleriaceae bacterium]
MFELAKNGVAIAIVAHALIGISLVWDKVLLQSPGTRNLYSYTFWLGAISVFGLLLIPFGYESPPVAVIALAFVAGFVHLVGIYFYYDALKRGEASESLAVMGGFSPVATGAIGYFLLSRQMSSGQLIGFALMTGGGFVMFFSENMHLKRLLPPMLLASGLLGLVNVLGKLVYNRTDFVSGYVWFTIGTFVAAVGMLARPSWRRQIFAESGQAKPRSRFWYFVNRFISGVGSFLVFYAISLAHPAIVDSIMGVRYAIIFIAAYLLTRLRPDWLKENFGGWQLVTKVAATSLVAAGLVIVGLEGKGTGGGSPTASMESRARSPHSLGEVRHQHDRNKARDAPGDVDRDEGPEADSDHTGEQRDDHLWRNPDGRAQRDHEQLALLPPGTELASLRDAGLELRASLRARLGEPAR